MSTLTWAMWVSVVTTAIVAYLGIERLFREAEQSEVPVAIPVRVDRDSH